MLCCQTWRERCGSAWCERRAAVICTKRSLQATAALRGIYLQTRNCNTALLGWPFSPSIAVAAHCPLPAVYSRAVIVAQLCTASTFFTLLSWLPTFFKETFPESKVSTVLGGRGGLGCLCCFQSLGWLSNERCRAGDTVLLQ